MNFIANHVPEYRRKLAHKACLGATNVGDNKLGKGILGSIKAGMGRSGHIFNGRHSTGISKSASPDLKRSGKAILMR